MSTDHVYVVLLPEGRGNPTDHYLVVHVREWVAVLLGEKEHYVFTDNYEDYSDAAARRDRLNHQPEEFTPCPSPTTSGVILVKSRQTKTRNTSPARGTEWASEPPATDHPPTAPSVVPGSTTRK